SPWMSNTERCAQAAKAPCFLAKLWTWKVLSTLELAAIVPGGFHEDAAGGTVAGLGQRAAALGLPRGIIARHESQVVRGAAYRPDGLTSISVSLSESDASFWGSACSQASLVTHPETGRAELSWVRVSPASSQNTHAHSALAVAAQASRDS